MALLPSRMAVQAMKAGASDFIEKPISRFTWIYRQENTERNRLN
jgi:FixJ family two-component response regulator